MKTLKEVYKYLGIRKKVENDCEFCDLEVDSRNVKKGDIFIALKGSRVNGLDYAQKAYQAGALAIIYEQGNDPDETLVQSVRIPFIRLSIKKNLGEFCSWFYDNPSKSLSLIGVTGTNGKSTITQLLAQWITGSFSAKCAVLGTLGFGFLPDLEKSSNTTLDAVRLQRTLADLVKKGARYAALEVSSIGVCEGRIDGCNFAAGGFTNLTRDHLDYHKTMENYAKAKLMFLSKLPSLKAAINLDDEEGERIAENLGNVIAYSCSPDFPSTTASMFYSQYVYVKNATYRESGIQLEIESSYGSGRCEISLLGGFNIQNFICALAIMLSLGFNFDQLMQTASSLRPVKGRMECFKKSGLPHIVVDYAHTPDGVEQVLRGVREHHPEGKIWCVLGCGGDRDKGKRPIMAIKASVYADMAVFTSDNPRTEDPGEILKDMAAGVSLASNVVLIEDRQKAIEYAFSHASQKDCVVIAGKGHEDYQIFKDRTIHFSDREIACSLLGVECD
ncbi:MAG: UDP-N-acetylmuramoyl-L-alanyl-D-glutamate--2,6-diaminopimelate ligase [Succinivibrio sp.]